MFKAFLASVAFLMCVLLSSCSKKKSDTDGYIGKWELRSTDGGLMGHREYSPGNGNLIVFAKDAMSQYAEHKLLYKHVYSIRQDTTYYFGGPRAMDRLINTDPNMNSVDIFLERKGNELNTYIGIPAADGGSARYARIN